MKKRTRRLLSILLSLAMVLTLLPATALAATSGSCGDNLTWSLDDSGKLTISGTGAMKDFSYTDPSTNDIPWWSARNDITSIVIEYGVTSIGKYAFFCVAASSVTIPGSVKTIADHAFNGAGLTSATIPDSVQTIGQAAFNGCVSMTSVTLPAGLETIESRAFAESSSLASVTIPSSVKTIGSSAFQNCTALTAIEIPASVTSIASGENDAFGGCVNLGNITVAAGNTVYHAAGNCLIETESKVLIHGCKASVIPADGSVTKIGSHAFAGQYTLESINIPDGVTEIGEYAFDFCVSVDAKTGGAGQGLRSVTIAGSVETIGVGAFGCNYALTSLTLSEGVKNIDNSAFFDCNALTSVNIPASVENMGYGAFWAVSKSESSDESAPESGKGAYGLEDIYIYSRNMTFQPPESTDPEYTYGGSATLPTHTVIHGYTGSTAQTYATTYNRTFVPFDEPCDHDWGSWVKESDTQHKRVCAVCSEEETADHTWDNGEVTTAATCTTDGVMTYTCTVCGATKTESLDKLTEHTYGEWESVDAEQHKHACICGETETELHTMGDWAEDPTTANSLFRSCSACGYWERKIQETAIDVEQGETDTAGNLVIDLTSENQSAVVLPDTVFNDIETSTTVAGATVVVGTASVTYDAAAVAAINVATGAESGTCAITLTVEETTAETDSGMTQEQQNTVNNAVNDAAGSSANVAVYCITLEVTFPSGDAEEVSNFNGGTATITVPYENPVGGNVTVQRVNDDGSTDTMNSSYNAADQTVTWTTGTHSFYMITSQARTPIYSDSGSSAPTYKTSVETAENGTVTVSPKNAEKGDQVTVTVTPDEGYKLDTLTVTDKNGKEVALTDKGNGKYTFRMPASKVTVSVSFAEIEPEPVKLPFTDVAENAWYADAVRYVYEKGLMGGSGSAETFRPEQPTSRGMLVTILYRLEGEPAVSGAPAYTDVPAGQYYTDAVAWATKSLIVNGYNGAFRPENALTRQDMAAILYRYAGYKGYDRSVGEDTNILSYTDALAVSEYAIPAMQWVCGSGIIEGANGALTPTGDATRSQTAAILMRFCESVAK